MYKSLFFFFSCSEVVKIWKWLDFVSSFCTCKVAWLMWSKCYECMDMTLTVHQEPKMLDVSKTINQIQYCVWIAVVRELWKQSNNKIFIFGRIDYIEIFTMV